MSKNTNRFSLIISFILLANVIIAQTYYSKPTGFLNDLATWGDQLNGTGTQPVDFTTPGQEFIIVNNANATIDNDWIVANGNKVIVGDGVDAITLTVPVNHIMEAIVDVEVNSTLMLQNAVTPFIDSCYDNSLVNYSLDAQEIYFASYYDLEIDNVDPTFTPFQPVVIGVRNNLTFFGTNTMPVPRDLPEPVEFLFNGDGDQIINANNSVLRAFDMTILKTAGELSVANGTTLSADNVFSMDLSGTASIVDNGETFYAGKDLIVSGDPTSYNLTGTVVLADEIAGIVKGVGDGNNFAIKNKNNQCIDGVLNNLTLSAANVGGTYNFFDGGNNLIHISGDLLIEEQVAAGVTFSTAELELEQDFIVENNFLGTMSDIESILFTGSIPQNFQAPIAQVNSENILVDNPAGVTLGLDIEINTDLSLLDGNINTGATSAVYLTENATITGSGANSYINGPMFKEISFASIVNMDFPIGRGGAYRPVNMEIDQTNVGSIWYKAEVIDAPAPTLPVDPSLVGVSNVRYYEIDQVTPADIDSLTLTFNYGNDDNIANINIARVAYNDAGEWKNMGGIGSAAPVGTVTNDTLLTSLGQFSIGYYDYSPTINLNPATLDFFTQNLGVPSPEQVVEVSGTDMDDDITITAPTNYEISLTSGAGFTNSIVLTETNNEVPATDIFVRLNRATIGVENGNLDFTSTGAATQTIALEGECVDPFAPGQDLIYYWHFNELEAPGSGVTVIDADFNLVDDYIATMTYNGSGLSDMTENTIGSSLNLQLGETAGKAVQVNNRSDNRSLIFQFNTEPINDVIFEYAVKRSPDGMLNNEVDYSTNGGVTYSQQDLILTTFPIDENYELVSVNLTQIAAANENPDLRVRINFFGNAVQLNGSNIIDNVTLKGDGGGLAVNENELNNITVNLYPNPANDLLNVVANDKIQQIQIIDVTGKIVMNQAVSNLNSTTLSVNDLNTGVYIVNVETNNGQRQLRLVKQ